MKIHSISLKSLYNDDDDYLTPLSSLYLVLATKRSL
jgi:hypothetical protein